MSSFSLLGPAKSPAPLLQEEQVDCHSFHNQINYPNAVPTSQTWKVLRLTNWNTLKQWFISCYRSLPNHPTVVDSSGSNWRFVWLLLFSASWFLLLLAKLVSWIVVNLMVLEVATRPKMYQVAWFNQARFKWCLWKRLFYWARGILGPIGSRIIYEIAFPIALRWVFWYSSLLNFEKSLTTDKWLLRSPLTTLASSTGFNPRVCIKVLRNLL